MRDYVISFDRQIVIAHPIWGWRGDWIRGVHESWSKGIVIWMAPKEALIRWMNWVVYSCWDAPGRGRLFWAIFNFAYAGISRSLICNSQAGESKNGVVHKSVNRSICLSCIVEQGTKKGKGQTITSKRDAWRVLCTMICEVKSELERWRSDRGEMCHQRWLVDLSDELCHRLYRIITAPPSRRNGCSASNQT